MTLHAQASYGHGMFDALDRAFAGESIWGDAFNAQEISAWFEDEREAYAALGSGDHGSAKTYGYHRLNIRAGFRHLPVGHLGSALGLGSAYGGEFLPIADRLAEITILEPSASLRSESLQGVPLQYVSPDVTGDMPFPDARFDLAMSLGTLHHIPNVSHVIAEIARVTRPGGHVLLREPTISMGDWREPRPGLTKRERGLPRGPLRQAFKEAGLNVVRETRCMFPISGRLAAAGLGFNSRAGVAIDLLLSGATNWNSRYHATSRWQKLRPAASFFVLRRD